MKSTKVRGSVVKVSVVIAVHNGERWIAGCVESVLAQTFQDFEIIVVNDGSSDGTLEKLETVSSERMTVIDFEVCRGVSTARNEGIRAASGEYVAILDADDVASPERLQEQVNYLDSHPYIALVGSYFELQGELGSKKVVTRPLDDEKVRQAIFYSCPVANTTVMMRREAFLAVGGYPSEFDHGEDYRFLVRFVKIYRVANIPRILVLKRETKGGLTFTISAWRHFAMGLSHRLFAASELKASPLQYIRAIGVSVGILLVRMLRLNRETVKEWMHLT